MKTKTLIERLEPIEFDYTAMRTLPIEAIVERVKRIVEPDVEEAWTEVTRVGVWRFVKLTFNAQPTRLALIIEQIGGDGLYSTYFTYEHIKQ
jgi:hypothetical protein